jgi:hypothetical protein
LSWHDPLQLKPSWGTKPSTLQTEEQQLLIAVSKQHAGKYSAAREILLKALTEAPDQGRRYESAAGFSSKQFAN